MSLKQQSSASEETKDTFDLLTLEMIFLLNQDLYYNYLHFYSCQENLQLVIQAGWEMAILQSESTSESHSKIFFTSLSWCRVAREFRVLQMGLWSGRVFCQGLSPRIPLATSCVYNILVITSRETLKYFLFRNFKYPFVETHGLKSFLTAYTGE